MAETATGPDGLKRQLGVLDSILITVSGVTPASSIFVIAPFAIQQAGSGAFLAFAVAGLLALAFAMCYAELGAAHQSAGGEYVIAKRVFGGLAGYVTFLVVTVGVLFVPAVLARGTAPYLNAALGTDFSGPAVALVTVLVCYGLGVLNIRTNAWITGAFLLVEMAVLALIAVIGLVDPHQPASVLTHPQMLHGTVLGGAPLAAIVGAVGSALFCYNGFGAAIFLSEDMRDPGRGMARAVLGSLGLVVLIEIVPVAAVLLAAPSLPALLQSNDPIGYIIANQGSATLSRVVAAGIFLSVFNAIIAIVIQTGRLVYSSGRDELWMPVLNRAFTVVHPRFDSPWLATLFMALPSALLTQLSRLEELTSFTVVLILLVYLIVGLAALGSRLLRSDVEHHWKMPLWPLWPVLAVTGAGYTLKTLLADSPTSDFVVLGGLLVTSMLLYGVYVRRSPAYQQL